MPTIAIQTANMSTPNSKYLDLASIGFCKLALFKYTWKNTGVQRNWLTARLSTDIGHVLIATVVIVYMRWTDPDQEGMARRQQRSRIPTSVYYEAIVISWNARIWGIHTVAVTEAWASADLNLIFGVSTYEAYCHKAFHSTTVIKTWWMSVIESFAVSLNLNPAVRYREYISWWDWQSSPSQFKLKHFSQ
jgi:hypothetical protein